MCAWHEPLANLWMHTGMLRVDGEKMSKSLGNFYTLKEVLDKYPADAVRLLMLQTHYRAPLDFSFDRLEGAVGTLERLRTCEKNLLWAAENGTGSEELDPALLSAVSETREEFTRQMDDDFNTAGGLAAIFSLVTSANTYLADAGTAAGGVAAKTAADALAELTGALGVTLKAEEDEPPAELVDLAAKYAGYTGDSAAEAADALIAARQAARKAKDWGTADGIRDAITGLGLVLEDTAAGSRLRKA
jgi:cysteinyl-tRNA synthetase